MSDKNINPASKIEIDFTRDKEMEKFSKGKKQNKVKKRSKGKSSEKPFILIGLIIIILIFAILFFIPGMGTKFDAGKIKILENRVSVLEKKLASNGDLINKIKFLENQGGESELSLERIEKRVVELSSKIIRASGNVDLILSKSKQNGVNWGKTETVKKSTKKTKTKKIKKEGKKKIPSQKVEKKRVDKTLEKKPKIRYHIVKKGDTLYNISRRYNLTVDQLRKINKLKKGGIIFLGQKLLVIK